MSDNPTVIVSEPLEPPQLKWLGERANVLKLEPADVPAHIAQADGLVVRTYTQVDASLLAKAERLKVVGRAGVALENIDVRACWRRGIQVVHTPAANTMAVVDYVMRMIVELNRKFWPMTRPMTPEEFLAERKNKYGRFLSTLTLGIVGVGRIGSRVGRAAAGLGMKVLVNDIIDIQLDYPAQRVDKDTLYANSDIVTIHVPLTDLTRGMIDAAALAKFRQGAQFINAARGPCMIVPDLAAAIRGGHIAGCVVDCHDPEPPPLEYPLYGLPNTILTPHVAARVPAALAAMCDVVYDVVAVLEGRPPQYPAQEGSF